jgi:asparagine synthase (glutamine-hydrolysing)
MCGIGGISLAKGKCVSVDGLNAVSHAMIHRGPDEEGIYVSPDGCVGLVHRRLKVIDLAGGQQPLCNEDGRIVLVYNGEIYNCRSLRGELVSRGHQFVSNSDTEVIVHLYEEHGVSCLKYLRGMFSFVLHDQKEDLLFGAIDRMGQKPLYYSTHGSNFYFASTFTAINRFSELPKDLDPESFNLFFSLTYIPAPKTIFREIRKLVPGTFFVWQKSKLSIERYWRINPGKKQDIKMKEAKSLALEKIEEAVRIRLMSDVPLGAFLSGGLDSSLIVALASQYVSGSLETFSIGFENQAYSELEYAREVARAFNTNHHEFILKPIEIESLGEMVQHFGEPFGDFSALPMWRLAEETRKHVTVALSGDGGDELFAGYPRYQGFRTYNALRSFLPGRLVAVISRLLGMPASDAALKRRLQRLFQILNQSPGKLYADLNVFLKPWDRGSAYTEALESRLSSSAENYLATIFEEVGSSSSDLDRMLFTDAVTYEVCQLTKVDIMTMAWSLEARCPLVDHELIELVFTLPDHFKMGSHGGKRLLREIAKDFLPQRILDRSKQGFTVPLEHWFRGEIRDYAQNRILNGRIPEVGWIRKEFMESILNEHFSGKRDNTYLIWNLLFFAEWLELC